MKAAAAAIVAAIGLSIPSAGAAQGRWNPRAPENNQVLPAFNYGNVEAVLSVVGARYQRTGSAREPRLAVTFPNGRKALLSLDACNASGSACKSLSLQASWTRISNSSPAETAEAIQRFNQRYSFAKAYIAADGRPGMQRYLTADYGFIRGNLAVNLLVFASQVDRFARDVLQPLEAG